MGAHSLLGVNEAAKLRLDDKNPCEYLDKHKTERRWIFKWSFMHGIFKWSFMHVETGIYLAVSP